MKDIRLSTEFWDHPKTVKFTRRLGLEGIRSLQILWLWARVNRPEGILTGMDSEDIEIAAKWDGEPERFVNESLNVRWVDVNDGVYELHDWADHNPWSVDSIDRGDKARLSRMAKTHPELFKKLTEAGINSISSKHYNMLKKNNDSLTIVNGNLTPAPAPAPAPSLNETNNNIADSVPESANLTIEDENERSIGDVDNKTGPERDIYRHKTTTEHQEPVVGENNGTGIQTLLPGIVEPGAAGEGRGSGKDLPIPGSSAVVCDGDSPGGRGRHDEQMHGHVRRWNSKGDDKGNPGKLDSGPRYRTSRKKWLSGQRLKDFEQFWQVFGDKRGKPGAAQSWLDLEDYGPELVKYVLHGAKRYCHDREDIKSTGGTPKMAQGWLTDRRWEDYPVESDRSKKPARTREQIRAEVYAKYGRKDLQEAATGANGKVATGNIVREGSSPPGPALQILFGG